MFIGDQIRAARLHRGMTQKELAEAVGVTETTVILWENKKNPRNISAATLSKVDEALGSSVSKMQESQPTSRRGALDRMRPLLVSPEERAVVLLFRSFPEKLQLLQLAQFVECANLSQLDSLSRDENGTTPTGADTVSHSQPA